MIMVFGLCCSDGGQTHGYVPNSVYRTRTQYRTQRYPTFVCGHPPDQVPDSGSPAKNAACPCCSEASNDCDEHCTYQANTSHLLTAVSSSTDGLHPSDAVNVTPCIASGYTELSSNSSGSHFVDDQSQYVSSCRSHATTPQFASDSRNFYGTSHTMSSNFYSMSSHYQMRSRLTLPASATANSRHVSGMSCTPSAVATVTTVTATQHRQNVIQVSKPFQSSDVLRYSEKLRRQRLNDSSVTPAEFL